MKKWFSICFVFIMLVTLSACGIKTSDSNIETNIQQQDNSDFADSENKTDKTVLVAYFSCTGNTKPLAEYTAEILNADLFEIISETPYTTEDLDYNNDNCRANQEQNDDDCRPAITTQIENMEQYDTVVLAFPIWWGKEPKIIDTFMETYDWSGKTIIPFCTSGGSGINNAENNLHAFTRENTVWLDGKRFSAGTSKDEIQKWIDELEMLNND